MDVRDGVLVSRLSVFLFRKPGLTRSLSFRLPRSLLKNNETALFEDNQADLEQAVEALSEMLEKPIDKDGIPALRQAVTDKTVRLLPFLSPLHPRPDSAFVPLGLRPEATGHPPRRHAPGLP